MDIPNLAFWVDAKDVNGTGVQPLNGALVSTWADKKAPAGLTLHCNQGPLLLKTQGLMV